MDINKEIFWWEMDHAFQVRLLDLVNEMGGSREELAKRFEEILNLRDQMKALYDRKCG